MDALARNGPMSWIGSCRIRQPGFTLAPLYAPADGGRSRSWTANKSASRAGQRRRKPPAGTGKSTGIHIEGSAFAVAGLVGQY